MQNEITVGSKIIQAPQIIRIKELIKHEMIKIGNQTRKKAQVLSQLDEEFCCHIRYCLIG